MDKIEIGGDEKNVPLIISGPPIISADSSAKLIFIYSRERRLRADYLYRDRVRPSTGQHLYAYRTTATLTAKTGPNFSTVILSHSYSDNCGKRSEVLPGQIERARACKSCVDATGERDFGVTRPRPRRYRMRARADFERDPQRSFVNTHSYRRANFNRKVAFPVPSNRANDLAGDTQLSPKNTRQRSQ